MDAPSLGTLAELVGNRAGVDLAAQRHVGMFDVHWLIEFMHSMCSLWMVDGEGWWQYLYVCWFVEYLFILF